MGPGHFRVDLPQSGVRYELMLPRVAVEIHAKGLGWIVPDLWAGVAEIVDAIRHSPLDKLMGVDAMQVRIRVRLLS